MSPLVDDEAEDVAFRLYDMLYDNDGMTIKELQEQAGKSPKSKYYIKRYCAGHGFLDFLRKFPNLFYIENNRVAQNDVTWEIAREEAVTYYCKCLEEKYELLPVRRFRGRIGQSSDSVIGYVNSFYPGDEFKTFLLSEPDIFVILGDGTVGLTEVECLDYFKEKLVTYKNAVHFSHFRGHVGQAPPHVKSYILTHFSGPRFREFLETYPDFFAMDVNGYVHPQ